MESSVMKHNLSVCFNTYMRERANWTDDDRDEFDIQLDQQLRDWGIIGDWDVIDSIGMCHEPEGQGDYLYIQLEDGSYASYVKIWGDGEYAAA